MMPSGDRHAWNNVRENSLLVSCQKHFNNRLVDQKPIGLRSQGCDGSMRSDCEEWNLITYVAYVPVIASQTSQYSTIFTYTYVDIRVRRVGTRGRKLLYLAGTGSNK